MSHLFQRLRKLASPAATTSNGFEVPSQTYGFPPEAFDPTRLPDFESEFIPEEDLEAFAQAIDVQDHTPDEPSSPPSLSRVPNLLSGYSKRHRPSTVNISDESSRPGELGAAETTGSGSSTPHTAQRPRPNMLFRACNDWFPLRETPVGRLSESSFRRRKPKTSKKRTGRTSDETREGFVYHVLRVPGLLWAMSCIAFYGFLYMLLRVVVNCWERYFSLSSERGRRHRAMRAVSNYKDWVGAAREMDRFEGNSEWTEDDSFAYYKHKEVRHALAKLQKVRQSAERRENGEVNGGGEGQNAIKELKRLVEWCVKDNFSGIEDPRLYSQTHYGTKNLVENFLDELERCLKLLIETKQLTRPQKRAMFKGICANYGRTALCLSGGATFAYIHFGIVKALLEEGLLPEIISGTSGGALVAALVATHTDEELKQLLVPALAHRIKACRESWLTCLKRRWKTGALFDVVDWARECSWFTRGSMTFREAYERTGRILNVSCVPNDPHTPTLLCNYLTCPDTVIWSAVLASAAVPGILNPVVLMTKTPTGKLEPSPFGYRWKDGSLRSDIPIKELNMLFNVRFTIVSQVNPHINLFLYASRGSVGQPVTHRKGRGWRGGWLGSACEKYLRLSMDTWVRWLRQVELLPRWMDQDWSMVMLQSGKGTINIWPTRTDPWDFPRILTDPDPARLARLIHEGQISAYPRIKFARNRQRIESLASHGRKESRRVDDFLDGTSTLGSGETRIEDDAGALPQLVAPSGLLSPGVLDGRKGWDVGARRGSIDEILSESELRYQRKEKKDRISSRLSGALPDDVAEEEEEQEEEDQEEENQEDRASHGSTTAEGTMSEGEGY
ncbi:hypothetical protein VTJ83DRAFT_1016 [Remersonia thermophila]|uniref:Patatin-like phospholipase domain-containing protein n=1 Tax=Remersonia thermophila TaxID=72144 RepID=A0ABR4DMX9_9PEZI